MLQRGESDAVSVGSKIHGLLFLSAPAITYFTGHCSFSRNEETKFHDAQFIGLDVEATNCRKMGNKLPVQLKKLPVLPTFIITTEGSSEERTIKSTDS